jgi:hypothetical protein
MMPQKLTVESLRFEWSTRTTHCSAVICQLAIAGPVADQI